MTSSPSPTHDEKPKQKKKHKDKGRSKEKAPAQIVAPGRRQGHGKNEGVDPNWAFQPPDGMVVLDTSQVDDDFDWDSLKDDESKELWILRLPEGFKTKHLDGLEIQQPVNAKGAKLMTVERKRVNYDIWPVGPPAKVECPSDKFDEERPPRGEELKGLTCLLPRKKKKGRLYIAPKQISQHIIITHVPAASNIDSAAAPMPSTRHFVPKPILKHRFLPFGASSGDGIRPPADAMDIDAPNDTGGKAEANVKPGGIPLRTEQGQTPNKKHSQSLEKAGKKRKNAGAEKETPSRRSKKLKI